MLVRVIYAPATEWLAYSFEVPDAPDFASALTEIDFPRELTDGDVLVQEYRKGGPYNWFQMQGSNMVQIDPMSLKKDPSPCTKCTLCTKALNVKIPHTWSKKYLAEKPIIMVIGMSPGREEDIDNTNFVETAPAGGLMRRLVREADVEDHEVVYTNIAKCFPIGEHGEMRDPDLDELKTCSPYLYEEIEELEPEIIVVCGSLAANFLLGTTGDKITQMRGRVFRITVAGKEYRVMPVIHPSAAVRTGRQDYMDHIRADIRSAKNIAQAKAELPNWNLVNDTEDAVALLWKVKSLFDRKLIDSVALDIETNDRMHLDTDEEEFVSMALWDPSRVILGVSLAFNDTDGYFIPMFHKESKVDVPTFLNVFKQIFAVEFDDQPFVRVDEAVPITAWNGRYDQSRFYVKHKIMIKLKFDGMLASYCVYTSTRKHRLKNALSEVFFWPPYDEPLYAYLREHHKKDAHYGHIPLEPDPELGIPGLAQYACYDATGTWKIRKHFEERMDDGLMNVHELLCRLSDYLVENESRGTVIDVKYLEKTEREYPKALATLLEGLGSIDIVGRFLKKYGKYNPAAPHQARILLYGEAVCRDCNFNSHSAEFADILQKHHTYCTQCGARSFQNGQWWNCPNRHRVKQIMKIRQAMVFDQCPKCFGYNVEKDEFLGLWPKAFTAKGWATTGEADQIQCLYEVAKYDDQKRLISLPGKEQQTRFILDNRTYKKMQKIYGYTKTIRKFLRSDRDDDMMDNGLAWLIYNYLIHWTATGRISTRDFSIHTAPAHSDIRRLFVSRWKHQGGLILSSDYSQLELRILACLAEDEDFRQAFRDGKDIHREVAARVFKKDYSEVTDPQRRYAKCVTGNTLIETDKGPIPIRELVKSRLDDEIVKINKFGHGRITQKILTLHGYRLFTHEYWMRDADVYRVTFDDGRFLDCTSNHRFVTGFDSECRPILRSLSELNIADNVLSIEDVMAKCRICGAYKPNLSLHLFRSHGIKPLKYLGKYPGSNLYGTFWGLYTAFKSRVREWTPEERERKSEISRQVWSERSEEFKAKFGAAVSERIKTNFQHIENRRKAMSAMNRLLKDQRWLSKSRRLLAADRMKLRWEKPDFAEKVVRALRKEASSQRGKNRRSETASRVNRNRGRLFVDRLGREFLMKSDLEVAYALVLDKDNKIWEYEPRTFVLTTDDGHTFRYTPDWFFKIGNEFHETKYASQVDDHVIIRLAKLEELGFKTTLVTEQDVMKLGGYDLLAEFKNSKLAITDPKVVSIEYKGKEEVFDLVEPEMKLFFTNGLLTEDTCSFGIVYGETAISLAEKTGLTVEEADKILNDIKYREFPGIGKYIDSKHKEAMETGSIRTVEGRLFHLPDIFHNIASFVNAAMRQAQNWPVQGSASDLTARVCIAQHNWYKNSGFQSRAWGFVHDAVESDIYPTELMPYLNALAYQMQEAIPNSLPYIRDANVPMVTEFELGTRWDGGCKVVNYGLDWLKLKGPNRFFKETIGSLYLCYPGLEIEILSDKPVKHSEEIILKRAYEGDNGGDSEIIAVVSNLA